MESKNDDRWPLLSNIRLARVLRRGIEPGAILDIRAIEEASRRLNPEGPTHYTNDLEILDLSPMTTWLKAGGFRDDFPSAPRRTMEVEWTASGHIDVLLTEWGAARCGTWQNDREFYGGTGATVEEAMAKALNWVMAEQTTATPPPSSSQSSEPPKSSS